MLGQLFNNAIRKWKKVKLLGRVWLFAALWTVARQAPLFIGYFRQEYWGGWPFPSPGDLSNPEIELMSRALADRFFTAEPLAKLWGGSWYILNWPNSLLYRGCPRKDFSSQMTWSHPIPPAPDHPMPPTSGSYLFFIQQDLGHSQGYFRWRFGYKTRKFFVFVFYFLVNKQRLFLPINLSSKHYFFTAGQTV